MNNKICILLTITIIFLLLPTGCDNRNGGGFPRLFGPMEKFDPINYGGTENSEVKIYAQDDESNNSIEEVTIDIDGGSDSGGWTTVTSSSNGDYGIAYFYDIPAGRHIAKATHDDYRDKILLVTIPGDGEYKEFTIRMKPYSQDVYESNDTFDEANDRGSNPSETLYARISSPADVDCFVFYTNEFYSIDINLYDIPEGCDYDVKLYRYDSGDYYQVEGSYEGGNSNEYIYHYVTAGYFDYYYIEIYSADNNCDDTQDYRLELDVY